MIDRLKTEWGKSLEHLLRGEFFRRLGEGTLTESHYRLLLREIYYNTRENPQSFALMAGHLKGNKRDLSPKIFRHCLAEYGHHNMALEDLRNLGADVSDIPGGRPLPTTEAMIAFASYQIQHSNPIGYLGYVYHLEMLPAGKGGGILKSLSAMGIPASAMSFLDEHAKADEVHTKWLEGYLRESIESEEDLEAVIHGAKGTARLHALMLQGILDAAEEDGDWKIGRSGASPIRVQAKSAQRN
ncbi:MAG TPA: iron-containing redox enzyme family protein [Fibrobacteria bacterium]|nr:iron-containing redox enzyme family protein [Fibrobacteria bacterium]